MRDWRGSHMVPACAARPGPQGKSRPLAVRANVPGRALPTLTQPVTRKCPRSRRGQSPLATDAPCPPPCPSRRVVRGGRPMKWPGRGPPGEHRGAGCTALSGRGITSVPGGSPGEADKETRGEEEGGGISSYRSSNRRRPQPPCLTWSPGARWRLAQGTARSGPHRERTSARCAGGGGAAFSSINLARRPRPRPAPQICPQY